MTSRRSFFGKLFGAFAVAVAVWPFLKPSSREAVTRPAWKRAKYSAWYGHFDGNRIPTTISEWQDLSAVEPQPMVAWCGDVMVVMDEHRPVLFVKPLGRTNG